MNWKMYNSYDGQYAEVGAFILEAHPNGSWVVRHKTGAIPCRFSELTPILDPDATIETAKVKCESEFRSMLADSEGEGGKYKDIAIKLCERYAAMRDAQRVGSDKELVDKLDADVSKFLSKQ